MADDFDAAAAATVRGDPIPQPVDVAQSARAGMAQATGTNPDFYAELMKAARRTGVPLTSAEAMPQEVKRQDAIGSTDFDSLAAVSPATAQLLADMPKLVHDDIGTLAAVEGAARWLTGDKDSRGFSKPSGYLGTSTKAGLLDFAGVGSKLLDTFNPFTTSQQEAATLYKNDPAGLARFNASAAGFLPRFQLAMSQGSETALDAMSPEAKKAYGSLEYATTDFAKAAYLSPVKMIGDAIRSLPTSVAMGLSIYLTKGAAAQAEADALAAGLSPALARTAAVAAASRVMAQTSALSEGVTGYAQQQGQTAASLEKLTPEQWAKSPKYQALIAQGYSPEAAKQSATASTSEEAGIVAGVVDAAVNAVGGAFLGKILTEGGRLLPRIGKAFTTEGLTEFVQGGGEQFGENLAMRSNIDPTQDLTKGVLENMVQGLFVGGITGGTFGGFAGRAHSDVHAAAAGTTAPMLADLMKFAAASKTRERSPDDFHGFMQSVTQDGPVEKLFINPVEMQKAGLDLTQVAALSPAIAQQIQQALATGQDIAVPTADIATTLPGTPLEQQFLQHLKTDPEGFSQAGAQAYMQEHGEAVRATVEKVLAEKQGDTEFKASMQRVEDNVRAQLKAANRFTDDVNAPYAALWSAFFGVQAAHTGQTPEALFAKYAPTIAATGTGALSQQETAPQPLKPDPALERQLIDARKRQSILRSILDCLGAA